MARLARSHNSRVHRLVTSPPDGQSPPSDTPGETTTTLTADARFYPIWAGELVGDYSFWFDVGAGLTGTFSIQGTNVPNPELTTDADWTTLSPTVNGAALAYAGAAGNTLAYGFDVMVEWIRLKFTFTGGSGTFRGFARVDDNR